MKKSELSVIIPVYNGQDYIGRCLDSVLRQRAVENYEIIVVNDGSTDNTGAILKWFADKNKNIHVITQANGGVSVARNNGIRASHGEYVTFVDCDDMVGMNIKMFEPYLQYASTKSRIGNLNMACAHVPVPEPTDAYFDDGYFVNMLTAAHDTNADVVLGGKITINNDEIYIRRHAYDKDVLYGTAPKDKDTVLLQADMRENANFALYRRNLLDTHRLRFLTNMKLDEDMLFCMLAVLYARRVATVQDVTYFYNRHGNTLSNILDSDERIKKYQIADIQRFSYLLHELGKMPQYAKTFNYWMNEYSRKASRYPDGYNNFAPWQCYQACQEPECSGCFIAAAMREQFKQNIETYLNIRAR